MLAVGLARNGPTLGTVSGFKLKYLVQDGSSYLLVTHIAIHLAAQSCGSPGASFSDERWARIFLAIFMRTCTYSCTHT